MEQVDQHSANFGAYRIHLRDSNDYSACSQAIHMDQATFTPQERQELPQHAYNRKLSHCVTSVHRAFNKNDAPSAQSAISANEMKG